jgi:putative two-component system response regulator
MHSMEIKRSGDDMPSKKHILIVDDTEDNIQVAMSVLEEDGYDFSFATNGEQAVSLVKQSPGKFDLILLDIMMPGLDGYGACKEIKSTPNTQDIPVIFLTAKSDMDSMSKGFSLGAVDFITKPFHADELLARVRTHVQLFAAKQLLQYHNIVLEYKVERVGKHTRRVSEMSALLAQLHPALTDEDADMLFYASPMHDVGKMTVPPEVLNKPGRYTEEEFCIMKDHTTNGHNLLRYSERRLMKAAAIIAHEHHEKWDGSGYPRQLKGAEIHIYGRIVSLADVFDALTHNRCYKDAWEIDDALAYIVDHRETQFDPELVDIMLTNLDRFKEIVSKS